MIRVNTCAASSTFCIPSEFDLFEQIVTNPVLLELADYKLGDGFQLNTVAALWRKPRCANR